MTTRLYLHLTMVTTVAMTAGHVGLVFAFPIYGKYLEMEQECHEIIHGIPWWFCIAFF